MTFEYSGNDVCSWNLLAAPLREDYCLKQRIYTSAVEAHRHIYSYGQSTYQLNTSRITQDTVRPPRGRQMLVVRRWRRQDGGPDAGTPLPPLQPVERPATDTMEGGGKSDGLESGQMQTRADL